MREDNPHPRGHGEREQRRAALLVSDEETRSEREVEEGGLRACGRKPTSLPSQFPKDMDGRKKGGGEDGPEEPAQRPVRNPNEPVTFDDALMRIGLGRGQYFSIATMCLLWMGEGMQMFICFYLPKAFHDEWGTPVDDVAWVDGSMFAGVFVGALLGGLCGDAYGRRPTLLFFASLSAVTGILCWYTMSFTYLLSIRFLVGVGAGGFAPSSLSITLEACPSPYRGRVAVAVPGFAGASGRVLTAVLAEMLYDPEYNPDYSRMGWRGAMLLCCLPFLLAVALGFYSVSESARWMLVKGRERDASEALHNLALKNGTEDEFPRGTALVPDPDEDSSLSWCASGCDLDRRCCCCCCFVAVSAALVAVCTHARMNTCTHAHTYSPTHTSGCESRGSRF